jgi:outer membrane protein TolC
MLEAQENAKIASTLSFEQYQSGLVSYTTVLDAQKRSFDAQSTLIKIKNRLITNRINLHFYLGVDFSSESFEAEAQ